MAMSKWIPERDPLILRRVGKTSEEAAELVKVCARITIQGMAGMDPETEVSNREALTKEIADVMAQCYVCISTLALDSNAIQRRVSDKMEQMREWEAMFASPRV